MLKNSKLLSALMASRFNGAFRNRYWNSKIEQKVFVLHLLKDGGGVHISERTRLGSFELEIDVSAAVWCMEILQEILLVDDNKPFFRKYRGSISLLSAEKYSNREGVFLKLSKLYNGRLKNIINPGGNSKWGWTRMADCMDNLMGKHFWSSKGGFMKADHFGDNTITYVRRLNVRDKENFGVHQGNSGYENKTKWSAARGTLAEFHIDKAFRLNWRNAVIIVRFSASLPWRKIELGLARVLKIHHVLKPFAADRVIIWSNNEEDKKRLEDIGLCTIPGVGEVCFERWNLDNQFTNSKIVCKNSWVGIEGLPINMWNSHVFKVIGEKCGGFLDLASCTADLTFLPYAILKIGGNKGGFIQEKLEIFCWGKRIQLKFFCLNIRTPWFHGVQNFLGKGARGENDSDVEVSTEKMIEAQYAGQI